MVGATEFYRTLSHDAGTGVAGESGRKVTCVRALLGAATGPKEPMQNCVNRQSKMDVDSAPCGQKKKKPPFVFCHMVTVIFIRKSVLSSTNFFISMKNNY